MLKDYGIIKGKVLKTQNDLENNLILKKQYKPLPHYNFVLDCNGLIYNANINVFSKNMLDPDLEIYYTKNPLQDLLNIEPFQNAFKLKNGVYKNINQNLCLDYLKGKYFDFSKFKIYNKQQKLVIFNLLNKYLQISKQKNFDVCLWGQLYDNDINKQKRLGIHDVHMNQGNIDGDDNGLYNDGALAIYSDTKIEFICFSKFKYQCILTDINGCCK